MDTSSSSLARKFINLILKASARWANWNPSHETKVGDYGKLDQQTGCFNKEGNIYDGAHIYNDENIANLVKEHLPKPAAREDVYIAASTNVKRSDVKLAADVSYIPHDTILKHRAKIETLKDRFLVTEVFTCPAYCLYLSNGNNEVIDLALLRLFPVPQVPGVTVGGEIKGKWWVQNTVGLFRSARGQHGKDEFTPLYMLKGIRKKRFLHQTR